MVVFINYSSSNKSAWRIILPATLVLLIITMLLPDTVNKAVKDSITLCSFTVIPSLFPFIVFNTILIACGFDRMAGNIIRRPFEALFHLNANLCAAYLIGIISGYPQGAAAVLSIYNKNGCTKEEAEHALAFCNNTGPAFLIGAIGSLCKSAEKGAMLFILQILISFLYGIITRPKKAPESNPKSKNLPCDIGFEIIPKSIISSVYPMAVICAFVIIFAVITELFSFFFALTPLPVEIQGLFYALLEISNAAAYIAPCSYKLAFPLLGFMVCWSGLSVHMQTYAIIKGKLSMKRYFTGKLIQGAFAFLFILFLQIA